MSIVEEIRAAAAANPTATKLSIPLARAEEFVDAVLKAGAEFGQDTYPLRVHRFLGLEFLGVSADIDEIMVS